MSSRPVVKWDLGAAHRYETGTWANWSKSLHMYKKERALLTLYFSKKPSFSVAESCCISNPLQVWDTDQCHPPAPPRGTRVLGAPQRGRPSLQNRQTERQQLSLCVWAHPTQAFSCDLLSREPPASCKHTWGRTGVAVGSPRSGAGDGSCGEGTPASLRSALRFSWYWAFARLIFNAWDVFLMARMREHIVALMFQHGRVKEPPTFCDGCSFNLIVNIKWDGRDEVFY